MSDFPTLQTKRLQLREITVADAPALLAIHGDAQAMRWFGAEPLTELQQAERLADVFAGWRKLPNPGVRWGIALQDGVDRYLRPFQMEPRLALLYAGLRIGAARLGTGLYA